MPLRARCGRALALVSAAVLAVLITSPGIATADDRPQANPQERAAAMIRPAVMYLGAQAYGMVRLPNGRNLSQLGEGTNMPFIATWSCTAFVVNPDGWVATAGHCVDPETAKQLILKRAAGEYISEFPDAPESRDPAAAADWLAKNARVEGDSVDGGPQMSVTLVYGSGTNVAGKLAANVADFRPLSKGDVALLKLEKRNLPSSELATDADVSIGTPILAVGYPESTRNITGPSLDPTNKSGTVSKKSMMGPASEYEIDAPVTEGMSGGPAIELNGKVIGISSFAPAGEPQPFNFVAPADSLAAMMAGKGVKARLGPADVYYRKGLDHYFAGHYTDAIDDFDTALALSPDYPGLAGLKTNAVNLRQQYGDLSALSGAPLVWYTVGGIVLVLAAGAGLTILLMKNRSGAGESAKASGLQLVTAVPGKSAGAEPDTATEPHFCSSCGAQHHPAEKFCPNCGNHILLGESALGTK
ncbi:hypothetical protein MMAN_32860 [Mycobacterium mantenii]|uniref:Trypsin n=1 Tax=Mycobacterium mantenii TaxID=560555 RepID=A0A1X0G2T9_MYCNT|nr:trypsin-like peptidase domain-containing protein [Mycobacterium mantenii]MCV7244270.1 trypsin-like peptidase domain-containing protein [Mycobacterium mantenii]ORB08332.1 trypsin [Mycobacterium mantenii]BBY39152.1 hypothetical protein MMAN_32860 [Mycobacterium mantenii]